jgi:hypothetical protein
MAPPPVPAVFSVTPPQSVASSVSFNTLFLLSSVIKLYLCSLLLLMLGLGIL